MGTRLISEYMKRQRSNAASHDRQGSLQGPQLTIPQHPDQVALNGQLEISVHAMLEDGRPPNTQKAMDPKIPEFFQFCELVFPNKMFKYNLTFDKVYKFMYYQSFREQKPRGGKKKTGNIDGNLFDLEVYREILSHFQHDLDPESAEAIARYPQPTKPIGRCCSLHNCGALSFNRRGIMER